MKTSKIAAACAALASMPLCAFAQSSVTMYGRIDASVNLQRLSSTPTAEGVTRKLLSSDTSLWGLRGTEDLGGGLRAYFKLESGFNVDTGAQSSPTTFWNRESYVGLGDSRWGAIQLGSQFAPGVWLSRATDPYLRSNNGAHLALHQGLRGYAAVFNNAVQYLTPEVAGFKGRLFAAPSEGGLGKAWGLEAEYAAGKFLAGLSYDATKATGASVGLPAAATVDSRTAAMAATYDFGFFKAHAWAQKNRIDGLSDVNGYMLGATIPAGTLGEIRTSVNRRNASTGNATLSAIGYFYYLSKRTTLYTSVARQNNDGAAAFRMWPSGYDFAAPAPGQDVTGLQLGVRHLF